MKRLSILCIIFTTVFVHTAYGVDPPPQGGGGSNAPQGGNGNNASQGGDRGINVYLAPDVPPPEGVRIYAVGPRVENVNLSRSVSARRQAYMRARTEQSYDAWAAAVRASNLPASALRLDGQNSNLAPQVDDSQTTTARQSEAATDAVNQAEKRKAQDVAGPSGTAQNKKQSEDITTLTLGGSGAQPGPLSGDQPTPRSGAQPGPPQAERPNSVETRDFLSGIDPLTEMRLGGPKPPQAERPNSGGSMTKLSLGGRGTQAENRPPAPA